MFYCFFKKVFRIPLKKVPDILQKSGTEIFFRKITVIKKGCSRYLPETAFGSCRMSDQEAEASFSTSFFPGFFLLTFFMVQSQMRWNIA